MTTTLIIAADLHVNSTVGLCTPVINLDDGGTYHASRSQRWLWECWLDFIQQADSAPGRKVLVLNGDLGELDVKRRSYQLITPNKATIMGMILDVLEPIVAVAEQVYVTRGTCAHTGKSAWLEEAIGLDLDNSVKEAENTGSWWHIRSVCEGVRVDIAHHAQMGGLPWTEKHAALRLAEKTMWRYSITYKQPVPHLVIRSHSHRTADSYNNYDTRAILTPAFCLPTEYNYRTGHENDLADYGGMLITCEDGAYTYDGPVLYHPAESKRLWRKQM